MARTIVDMGAHLTRPDLTIALPASMGGMRQAFDRLGMSMREVGEAMARAFEVKQVSAGRGEAAGRFDAGPRVPDTRRGIDLSDDDP